MSAQPMPTVEHPEASPWDREILADHQPLSTPETAQLPRV